MVIYRSLYSTRITQGTLARIIDYANHGQSFDLMFLPEITSNDSAKEIIHDLKQYACVITDDNSSQYLFNMSHYIRRIVTMTDFKQRVKSRLPKNLDEKYFLGAKNPLHVFYHQDPLANLRLLISWPPLTSLHMVLGQLGLVSSSTPLKK